MGAGLRPPARRGPAAAGPGGPVDELDRLRREHAEARELSRRDSLTATYNRRYLDECLATLLDQPVDPAVRTVGLSVALVDIDHFKLVNDTYGHLLGDRVLQRLVGVLGSGLPGGAFCARFGGEEFALVLPGHGYAESVEVCEVARDRVARHPRDELADGLHVTVSAGVAHCVGWPTEVERLVGEADVLLYTAKQAGRNAVAFRDDEPGSSGWRAPRPRGGRSPSWRTSERFGGRPSAERRRRTGLRRRHTPSMPTHPNSRPHTPLGGCDDPTRCVTAMGIPLHAPATALRRLRRPGGRDDPSPPCSCDGRRRWRGRRSIPGPAPPCPAAATARRIVGRVPGPARFTGRPGSPSGGRIREARTTWQAPAPSRRRSASGMARSTGTTDHSA